MKKYILLWSACAALSVSGLQAQVKVSKGLKWDMDIERVMRNLNGAGGLPSRSGARQADTLSVLIECADAAVVADSLSRRGYAPSVIAGNVAKAKVAAEDVEWLAALPGVTYVSRSRQLRPLMTTARAYSNADKAHTGEGLETPFTGKGVVIGVIDRGFQYDHVAFKDADRKTRVVGLWNHNGKKAPTTTIPAGGDGITGVDGHATHVTGIAAGSRIEGNDYYGMAPDADIVMVPSTFSDDDILEEAVYIKNLAEAAGKPWVINMSFGSQYGPHDGTTSYDRAMDKLTGPGALLVAAMGNEGGTDIHAAHTFANAGEVKTLLMNNRYAAADGSAKMCTHNVMDLWNVNPSGKQELSVKPFVYDAIKRRKNYLTDKFWAQYIGGEINKSNGKEHYTAQVDLAAMAAAANIFNAENAFFGIEIQGDAGVAFHAWAPMYEDGYGEFVKKLTTDIVPDDEYIVGEGAASIPRAIAVASYNGASGFTAALDNKTYSFNVGVTQAISDFSSRGPWLGEQQKPTVAAPGATIAAPVNKYVDFSKTDDLTLVSAVSSSTGAGVRYATASVSKSDFYGVKCGTSMASPAVAGIVALWLQANPMLTYEDVVEIFRSTAKHDLYTGTAVWNNKFGYGKIDAYEGLKMALRLSNAGTGIGAMLNGPAPVTLQRETGRWRVLFNNDESYADLSVYTVSGEQMSRRHVDAPRCGEEVCLSFESLTPGVYIVRIDTTSSSTTRKVVVR